MNAIDLLYFKHMKFQTVVSITIGVLCVGSLLPAFAQAQSSPLEVQAFVNGVNVKSAASRAAAINLSDSSVSYSVSALNTSSQNVEITKVVVDYASFLPNKEFAFVEVIKPGQSSSRSGSLKMPDWALNMRGYFEINVYVYNSAGSIVARESFWLVVGRGNVITSIPGAAGAALAGTALATGVASVVAAGGGKPPSAPTRPTGSTSTPATPPNRRGRKLGAVSGLAMSLAVLMLGMALGIVPIFRIEVMAAALAAGGVGWTLILRLMKYVYRAALR